MAVERYSSKTDVIVKLVLVFFISLLSFSIGTFVGKKFSDNQHKLSQLEPSHDNNESVAAEESTSAANNENRGVASIPADAHSVKPGEPLSDDEIAKLAEEFVSDEETNPAPGATGHGEKPQAQHEATVAATEKPTNHEPQAHASETAAETHREPSSTASKIVEGKTHAPEKPAAVANEHRIPSALPSEVAASAVGKYTVQVAAYPKEDEAKNMANELKSKGFSAFYIDANVKGKTWYRVNVGLFTTPKEATAYRDDLLARAKVGSAIVQKIVK